MLNPSRRGLTCSHGRSRLFDPGVLERLKQLQDKYAAMGQDLTSYLDGLLHADFPTYWDYINPIPCSASSSR